MKTAHHFMTETNDGYKIVIVYDLPLWLAWKFLAIKFPNVVFYYQETTTE